MHKIRCVMVSAAAILLTGCGVPSVMESSLETMPTHFTTTLSTTMESTTITEHTTTTLSNVLNPLTGEGGYREAAEGKRPVAVMVNNLKFALPQYGIAAADIIYEMPVEAGITRLMAVYADYEAMPNICSIRSCRYYYPILAYGMDAIYCHWGMDMSIAKETLLRLKIDHLDGGGNGWNVCFFRDTERAKTYAKEHTGYLDGSMLPKAIETYGFRTDTEQDRAFQFRAPDLCVATGTVCTEAVLHFSKGYWSTFVYEPTAQTYQKQHNSQPHMDSSTGTQLAFTNLFVLQTKISLREDHYLVNVALDSGSGYYLSAGAIQPIQWEKHNESEPIRVYDANGAELQVNAGKSYIALIDTSSKLEFLT